LADTSTLSLLRVLVFDDYRSVRESLRRSLAFNGCQVDLATEALGASRIAGVRTEREVGEGQLLGLAAAGAELVRGAAAQQRPRPVGFWKSR
jgi:DNA-binding NtrC family response regulator